MKFTNQSVENKSCNRCDQPADGQLKYDGVKSPWLCFDCAKEVIASRATLSLDDDFGGPDGWLVTTYRLVEDGALAGASVYTIEKDRQPVGPGTDDGVELEELPSESKALELAQEYTGLESENIKVI
jgi:hypothetical protein